MEGRGGGAGDRVQGRLSGARGLPSGDVRAGAGAGGVWWEALLQGWPMRADLGVPPGWPQQASKISMRPIDTAIREDLSAKRWRPDSRRMPLPPARAIFAVQGSQPLRRRPPKFADRMLRRILDTPPEVDAVQVRRPDRPTPEGTGTTWVKVTKVSEVILTR